MANSIIDTVCNICMAAGGIGTVGTLIYMILASKKQAKQIDTVQKIQSQQLESLYEPDIRLLSWMSPPEGRNSEIVIRNCGENLLVSSIKDISDPGVLNAEGMTRWFPLNFDKGNEVHVPLSTRMDRIESAEFGVLCSNRLGLEYMVSIHIVRGIPRIEHPVLK